MDKRLELIDALLTLGRQCERVAKLLSADVVGPTDQSPVLIPIPASDRSVDPDNYGEWPPATDISQDFSTVARKASADIQSLDHLRILEYSIGPTYPISVHHKEARVDLITDDYKFTGLQPSNTRILNSFKEAGTGYDVGIAWETLEFNADPVIVLTELKQRCKKILVRFRPWSSRAGAFAHRNPAFAHLAQPTDHHVRFKVVRPLATYEGLFAKLGLTVHERKVASVPVEDFFHQTDEVLEVIIGRTWGTISPEDAYRIMATDTIEYLVSS
jgi:hypothetical protein